MRHEDYCDLNVAEIMNRWPATIGVFIDLRMHCIGCPIGQFHTLADAAEEHMLSLELLTSEIARTIASSESHATRGHKSPGDEIEAQLPSKPDNSGASSSRP